MQGSFDFIVNGKTLDYHASAGGSFGELALLYNSPRQASVQATSEATVWRIDRQTFRSTLANSTNKQKEMITAALSRAALFAGMTDEQLERVADAVQIVKHPANHRIIEKGTQGDIFYMIQSGDVKCTDIGEPGMVTRALARALSLLR